MPILQRNRGPAADAEHYGFVPGEEADVARPGGGGRGGQQDLRTLLGMLWRRKALIIGVTAIGTTLSVLMANRMTPVYEAEARLVLEAGRTNVTAGAIENVVQGLNPDFFTHETEAEIIMSRSLATKVVDKLNLVENPLFNPDLRPPSRSLLDSIKDLIPDEWLSILGSGDEDENEEDVAEEDDLTPAEYDAMILDWVTEDFMSGLYVDTALRSNVLFVSYSSTDPEMAAKAANAVADVYILDQLSVKYEATERANAWLGDRVNELRQRLEYSSQELENFRRQAGLLEIDGSSIFTQQYAELSTEAAAARTRRAEARYNQVQQLLGSNAGIESAAAVLDSPLIQRLREQEAEVLRKLGELKTQLREGHPQMVLARTELEDLQEKINSEVRKIVTNLGNELEIARVREANLRDEVDTLGKRITQQNQSEITIRELESVVETDRELYETVLSRFKEIDVQQSDVIQPDARVISYATVPGSPSKPNKRMIVAAGLILSLIVGVSLAFVREQLDTGFRTLEQIEEATGVPTIGHVPRIGRVGRSVHRIANFVVDKPNSAFAESLRTLRTALLLSNVDRPPKVVMFTSAVPGEGKTLTALSTARAAAMSGQKVLIIDCDLRKPSVQDFLEVPNDSGIVECLSHEKGLEDVIQMDFKSGAHFILAGPKAPNPTDVLASDQMRDFLAALTDAYDLIVLDTPPVMAVSDSLVLSRMADKIVFLVRWERTRREATVTAVRRILESGAELAGIVLTQVDAKRHDRYYNRASGYYGEYNKYYSD